MEGDLLLRCDMAKIELTEKTVPFFKRVSIIFGSVLVVLAITSNLLPLIPDSTSTQGEQP